MDKYYLWKSVLPFLKHSIIVVLPAFQVMDLNLEGLCHQWYHALKCLMLRKLS